MKRDVCSDIVNFFVKLFHLKLSKKNVLLLVQIFKFGIVGVVATLIDFIFLYIFKDVCNLNLILSVLFAPKIRLLFLI